MVSEAAASAVSEGVAAPIHGTLHEDGLRVWDGKDWVPHGGPQLPMDHRAEWPDRLVMSSQHGWQPRRQLYISTPTYGGTAHAEYMKSVIDLTMGVTPWGIVLRFGWPRGDGIARCRNRELASFLETDDTHFVCIDSDIGFSPKHLVDMLTSGLDFTAGAYPAKGWEWPQIFEAVKTGRITTPEQMEGAGLRFVINYRDEHAQAGVFPTVDLADGRRFVEVAEASTGFWVVRRRVIEAMVKSYPELAYLDDTPGSKGRILRNLMCMGIDPGAPYEQAKRAVEQAALNVAYGAGTVGEMVVAAQALAVSRSKLQTGESLGRYLSEDYAFCRLATMLGVKVYVYLAANLSHTGICVYSGSYADSLKAIPTMPPPEAAPELPPGPTPATQEAAQ